LADLDEAEQKELFRRLYLALIAVNILEGIRFYVSFACSFAFGENKLMEGSAKILSLIARDENIHLTITQHIINKYRDEENNPVMHAVMKECRAEAEKMFRDAVEEEKRWAAHLFKSGSMIGLNERLLCDYVEYLANRRLRAIGLGKMFDQPLNHSPLPWMSNWLSSKALQEAPQETEKESYLVGSLKQDVDEDTLSGFSL
jgi:ribonucleotide reductase beta subunit family protein with ferritin-like domain